MKVAVIGSGAMGCLYGAYISREHEVIMIDAYKPQVDAINEKGITIEEHDGNIHTYKNVKAVLSGEMNESVDLVILFVKSYFTDDALEQNASLFKPHTLVMTLQNGAGNDRKIQTYVKPENVIIGTSKHNSVNLGQGAIRHLASGTTTIGSNYGAQAALTTVEQILRDGCFEVAVSDDIQRIIWSKLLVNLSVNAFTAITETPIGYMIQNDYAWNFAKRLIYEAVEVAEADGTYFDRREALALVHKVCVDAGDGYSSMYQDKKHQVKMEIDAINGAIVEQAKLYGVPTPYNSLVVDLIHAIEGGYAYQGK